MKTAMRMAARNVFRHPGRSLTIIIFLFLLAAAGVLGLGILQGMQASLAEGLPSILSGDLMVVPSGMEDPSLFGTTSLVTAQYQGRPVLPEEAGEAAQLLSELDSVAAAGGIGFGPVLVDYSGSHWRVFALGTDLASIRDLFPGYAFASFTPPSGSAVYFHQDLVKVMERSGLKTPRGGETVRLLSGSEYDFRISGNTYVGTFAAPGLLSLGESFVLCDSDSLGYLLDLKDPDSSEGEPAAADSVSLDSLFAGTPGFDQEFDEDTGDSLLGELDALFGSPGEAEAKPIVYHALAVRKAPGVRLSALRKEIERVLDGAGWKGRYEILEWDRAVGGSAFYLKWLFLVFIAGVSAAGLAGFILMRNLMVGTVLERLKEFGTMMSMGSKTKDVEGMFLLEALLMAASSVLPGAAAGAFLGFALDHSGIVISNSLLATLLGFRGLTYLFDPGAVFVLCLGLSFFLGAAAYFPVRRQLKKDVVSLLRKVR